MTWVSVKRVSEVSIVAGGHAASNILFDCSEGTVIVDIIHGLGF